MRINADRAQCDSVFLGYNRSDIRHNTDIVMSHNAQRDRILRSFRLARPSCLYNPVTEAFAHLIRIGAVSPVNLDSSAYRHKTEYIVTINRITTFGKLEFQPFQVLMSSLPVAPACCIPRRSGTQSRHAYHYRVSAARCICPEPH